MRRIAANWRPSSRSGCCIDQFQNQVRTSAQKFTDEILLKNCGKPNRIHYFNIFNLSDIAVFIVGYILIKKIFGTGKCASVKLYKSMNSILKCHTDTSERMTTSATDVLAYFSMPRCAPVNRLNVQRDARQQISVASFGTFCRWVRPTWCPWNQFRDPREE